MTNDCPLRLNLIQGRGQRKDYCSYQTQVCSCYASVLLQGTTLSSQFFFPIALLSTSLPFTKPKQICGVEFSPPNIDLWQRTGGETTLF